MSRLGSNLVVASSALLLLGVGWLLITKQRLVAENAVAEAGQDREIMRLREQNRLLRAGASPVAEPSAPVVAAAPIAPPADPAAHARIASGLIRSGLLGQMMWPNPNHNSLAAGMADVAEMLGLTAAETAALQEAVQTGEKEFSAAVLRHASVRRDGSMVTIAFGDEPEVRAAYSRMLDAMAAVLGPERYGYYESLGAKAAVEKLFNQWGLEPSTLMVSHSTVIPDAFYQDPQGNPRPLSAGRPRGSGRLLYYETQKTPGQPGVSIGGTDTLENLGINIGPVQALIPPDL